ncbi:Uncharacterised protein [Vibrio cholerae]|nr:Uncharacterised protein [Vibrio cholerae]CSC07330.1 Uncharacterised protein [Vibrio cholerae]
MHFKSGLNIETRRTYPHIGKQLRFYRLGRVAELQNFHFFK